MYTNTSTVQQNEEFIEFAVSCMHYRPAFNLIKFIIRVSGCAIEVVDNLYKTLTSVNYRCFGVRTNIPLMLRINKISMVWALLNSHH
jgi:hypothetical protein